MFTDEDAQLAARVEAAPTSSLPPSIPSNLPPATSSSASGSNFSFAHAQRRPTLQSQLGGMGGSMRPPGKSGLSFDHILSRLQGEIHKSHETGAELHSLSTAMNDIRDTLCGAAVRPPYISRSYILIRSHSHKTYRTSLRPSRPCAHNPQAHLRPCPYLHPPSPQIQNPLPLLQSTLGSPNCVQSFTRPKQVLPAMSTRFAPSRTC